MKVSLNKIVAAGVALAACALGLLSACSSHGPQMKVGVVNTARIVAEHPKYQEISVQWMEKRSEIGSMVPKDPDSLSDAEKKSLQEKLNKAAAEKSGQMDKLVRDFMEKIQADIKNSAAEVAREKGLDAVIIDTPGYPTVLYNAGENITTDILLKLDTN